MERSPAFVLAVIAGLLGVSLALPRCFGSSDDADAVGENHNSESEPEKYGATVNWQTPPGNGGGGGGGGGTAPPAIENCLAFSENDIDFGVVLVGTSHYATGRLKICGWRPVEITGISLSPTTSAKFTLIHDNHPAEPSQEHPLILNPGQQYTFTVNYAPTTAGDTAESGYLVGEVGEVRVTHDAFPWSSSLLLLGTPVEDTCPIAVIALDYAANYYVGKTTVLNGYSSFAMSAGEVVTGYKWTLEKPPESSVQFVPSDDIPNPAVTFDVEDSYRFCLAVTDSSGQPSCTPACAEIDATNYPLIRIELTWHTPGDPDEQDIGPDAGADFDLHFAHPEADGPDVDGDGYPDPWFDMPFDCFWFNPYPNWGWVNGEPHGPQLVREDRDGAGPEVIVAPEPEELVYRVGAHYWSDHGYGTSYATVRILFGESVVYSEEYVTMEDGDFWEVCTIDWANKTITPATDESGSLKITPKYQNPYFFP